VFTASTELRDKLERLKVLMRSSVPDGDLAAVIDAAVTEKLARMEARRFGRAGSPRRTVATGDTSGKTRAVPAAVKRQVHERHAGRCVFVDGHGNRCTVEAPRVGRLGRAPDPGGLPRGLGSSRDDPRAHRSTLAVCARAFGEHRPARTTIQAAAVPGAGPRVQIDAVAYVP
jgi:hypothetical protein